MAAMMRASASRRRDGRRSSLIVTLALVALGGAVFSWFGSDTTGASADLTPARVDARRDPAGHVKSARDNEVRRRFDQAVVMLHAKQFEHAATALHRVLELAPQMPEAHVNMGYAMLGLKRFDAARDFFDGATALNPSQANAYYGMALAFEAQGEFELAIGAMRSYLHLARNENDDHLRRARAALWEWEAKRGSPVAPLARASPDVKPASPR